MSKTGVCTQCGEWTELNDSCCGDGVWIEGGVEYPDDDDDSEDASE